MRKREIAYELASYKKREIYKIIKAAMYFKKYEKLTKETESLEDMVNELEETDEN